MEDTANNSQQQLRFPLDPATIQILKNLVLGGITASVAKIVSGTGISIAPSGGTGNVTITNAGVTSNVAGTGITVSGPTGVVTITNAGVTSVIAGPGIAVSGPTGAVTFSVTASISQNNGVDSWNWGSGTQTIAHGLGKTPAELEVIANSAGIYSSAGTYNGTTQSCVEWRYNSTTGGANNIWSSNIVRHDSFPGAVLSATVTWDAMNLYFAWSLSGSLATSVLFTWIVRG